jgi:hypothetical protein
MAPFSRSGAIFVLAPAFARMYRVMNVSIVLCSGRLAFAFSRQPFMSASGKAYAAELLRRQLIGELLACIM